MNDIDSYEMELNILFHLVTSISLKEGMCDWFFFVVGVNLSRMVIDWIHLNILFFLDNVYKSLIENCISLIRNSLTINCSIYETKTTLSFFFKVHIIRGERMLTFYKL